MSRKKNSDIPDIMAEQLRLLKAEKEIKEMIEKINSQLNELLVEEFQLKSNEILTEYIITEVDTKPTNAEIIATFDSQLINQQQLDVSMLSCSNINEMEEDEDE